MDIRLIAPRDPNSKRNQQPGQLRLQHAEESAEIKSLRSMPKSENLNNSVGKKIGLESLS